MAYLTIACDAVLFDLDGVLVDSRAVVERTWERWAARHGRDVRSIVATAHGRRSSDTIRQIAPDLDVATEVRWLDEAELHDVEGLRALPGAAAALHGLPDTRRAVVTSGGRELATMRLRNVGLDVPAVFITSEEVSIGKPDPAGYLLAARRLGCEPRRCVVVEDTNPGITAGRAAGCRVVAVTTTFGPASLHGADVVVRSLSHVVVSLDEQRVRLTIKREHA
ncbi:MAG: HAD-IA family hydrolase [Gemmatimonadota bacterium]